VKPDGERRTVNVHRHAETVMGTVVSFDLRGDAPGGMARAAIAEVMEWLHFVDATFSTYRADSQISRLDSGDLSIEECDCDVTTILALCNELRLATNGYFDARASGRLDPSGVVKGWSIERASAMLVGFGWPNHVVNGGGDVRLRGHSGEHRLWRVAIDHPYRMDAYCAVVALHEGAVATSGSYRRGFHVTDPHRGRPATALASVTVLGPELTMTDAYATAALAMGLDAREWLEALPDHESFVVDADGNGWSTPGFDRHRFDLS
jgi:thiamine biosynthesis lipoprotein